MLASLSKKEMKALRTIANHRLSCGSLARELKVSRATAATIISALRKKGLRISTTRDSSGWFYELLAKPDPALSGLIGAGGRGGSSYSVNIDEDLVEHLSGQAKKNRSLAR